MIFFPLTAIILSGFGILFLVLERVLEVRNGRLGFFAKISSSTDDFFSEYFKLGQEFLEKFSLKGFKKIFSIISRGLFYIFGVIGLFVSKYYSIFLSRVNGRKILKNRGVVSFFLKDVAESKGKEKREDSNQEL